MILPTVSCCIFVHNDLEMLRATMIHEARWVDQFCILDLGSSDGTQEFCNQYLGEGDVYVRREENTCPTLGFGEARTACMTLATMDWVYSSAANCMLVRDCRLSVKEDLAKAEADVLAIETMNVEPNGDYREPWHIECALLADHPREHHRVFIRRGCGVMFKGYIHEEPYRGEVNCFAESELLPSVSRYHFAGWGDNEFRQQRYAWMLMRAWHDHELRKYTNKWWYEVHIPQNLERLTHQASEYLRRGIV